MSDLGPGPLEARGRREDPSATQGGPLQKKRTLSWRGWYGGVAMLIVCMAPEALLVLGRPGDLRFHVGAHFGWDVGAMLAGLPGIAAFTLLAPLVGYRRRDALLVAIPFPFNVYLAWVAGARAVQLRPGDTPHRWAGSREAISAAVLMQGLAGAAYVAWVIVISVLALP